MTINRVIHFILKYSWMIREYRAKDGSNRVEHKFNLWNPAGYIVLIVVAIIGGLVEGCRAFYTLVKETIKDSL
jgi:hypothetical protein